MLDSKDLELLQAMMQEVVSSSEARMTAKIAESETRMTAKISESETRMTAKIAESAAETQSTLMAYVDSRIQSTEARMTAKITESAEATRSMLMAYIESAIEPKLQLLAEGHKTLRETLASKARVDRLEEEVSTIRTMVMALGNKVKVAEIENTR